MLQPESAQRHQDPVRQLRATTTLPIRAKTGTKICKRRVRTGVHRFLQMFPTFRNTGNPNNTAPIKSVGLKSYSFRFAQPQIQVNPLEMTGSPRVILQSIILSSITSYGKADQVPGQSNKSLHGNPGTLSAPRTPRYRRHKAARCASSLAPDSPIGSNARQKLRGSSP